MTERQKRILKIMERAVLACFFVGAVIGGIIFGWVVAGVSHGEELSLLANFRPTTPTRLYDRNGEVFAELFLHRQELVQYQNIPPHVVHAFLAVEDDNFYNHFGIDFFGILRAAVKNVISLRVVQGGSTLTQQLAKQIYLFSEGERGRTFTQKIRETLLALEMEELLSKNEILEVYFNAVYLGHGCRGLACASKLYFGKKVEDLSVPEGALLARLPKSPVEFSPFKDPKEAMRQHKIVLRRMADVGYIPKQDVDRMHREFWEDYWGRVIVQAPSQNIYAEKMDLAPYFTDYVRQVLEAQEEIGQSIYTKGLRVHTTLDLRQQRIADDEMKRAVDNANKVGRVYALTGGKGGVDMGLFGLYSTLASILPVGHVSVSGLDERGQLRKEIESGTLDAAQLLSYLVPEGYNVGTAFEEFRKDTISYTTNLEVQGAFLGIEPRTGYITTMIGGSKFSPTNQFNRAMQARRQPGSAFKIFVYGAALEERVIGSSSALNDAPFFTISPDGRSWAPENYDPGFRGLVPVETAFALSLNTCAVQTYFKVGPDPIIDFASRLMKIKNKNRFNPDPAIALGASEITPYELATAVSIIANDGKDVIPFAVRYVTDQSGNVLYDQETNIQKALALKTKAQKIQVIEPGTAFILRQMMKAVADHGTAHRGVRGMSNFMGDIACKTGTTSSWSDAWIGCFNPEYATVLWFGFDKSSVTLGPGQAGGYMAAPVAGSFYRRFYKEAGQDAPSFSQRPDHNEPTPDIVKAGCGGWS
ncbi:MAG: transglycosylase domain-containing protein, partial [Spirochaetia bacterium]|nr:transglycosylase domain-containing protein [Spirochaetia bacterium]